MFGCQDKVWAEYEQCPPSKEASIDAGLYMLLWIWADLRNLNILDVAVCLPSICQAIHWSRDAHVRWDLIVETEHVPGFNVSHKLLVHFWFLTTAAPQWEAKAPLCASVLIGQSAHGAAVLLYPWPGSWSDFCHEGHKGAAFFVCLEHSSGITCRATFVSGMYEQGA